MTTTFVFGAGASFDAGYPLASQMGETLFDFMLGSADVRIRASSEFLIDTFGRLIGIEDLITAIEARTKALKNSQSSQDRMERARIANHKAFLGVALVDLFRQIRPNQAPSYRLFADEIVQPGDVVITFNYDDSLERELKRAGKWDISDGYGFPLGATERTSDVTVLKLHGSINWLVSVFGGAAGGTFLVNPISSLGNQPVIHQVDLDFIGCELFPDRKYQGGGAFPCLILPGRTKEFFYDTSFGHEFSEFWDLLWWKAKRAMESTERLVVCGYSLPDADQRARDLLLNSPTRETRVDVICGNDTERITNHFKTAGFRNPEAFKGGFFLDWCTANSPSQPAVDLVHSSLIRAER